MEREGVMEREADWNKSLYSMEREGVMEREGAMEREGVMEREVGYGKRRGELEMKCKNRKHSTFCT